MLRGLHGQLTGSRSVVVTGLGVVGPFGVGTEALWEALRSGRTSFRQVVPRLEHLPDGPPVLAAPADSFEPKEHLGPKGWRTLNRESQLLLAASLQAVRQAGLNPATWDPASAGVYTGTSWAGLDDYLAFHRDGVVWGMKRVNPAQAPNTGMNAPAAQVAIRLRARGPNFTVSTGTTSSLEAIGRAMMCIRRGQASYAIAGGVDCLSYYRLQSMISDGRAPTDLPRPYDLRRSLPCPGEAAAVLLLESAESAARRGVEPLAVLESSISGLASERSGDSRNDTANGAPGRAIPVFDGAAQILRSFRERSDGAAPDAVFASGSGDRSLDLAEALAIAGGLGDALSRTDVVSLEGCVGQCDGAAGALRLAGAVLSLRAGLVPGTTGFESADPLLRGLPVRPRSVPKRMRDALVLGLDPSGHFAAIHVEKPTATAAAEA